MPTNRYWVFQGTSRNTKVCQQEISELCNLLTGLLAFEKKYLNTHGERTPVFRLTSMINRAIAENIDEIERKFISGDLIERPEKENDGIPF